MTDKMKESGRLLCGGEGLGNADIWIRTVEQVKQRDAHRDLD
jgi:hypothetical protein